MLKNISISLLLLGTMILLILFIVYFFKDNFNRNIMYTFLGIGIFLILLGLLFFYINYCEEEDIINKEKKIEYIINNEIYKINANISHNSFSNEIINELVFGKEILEYFQNKFRNKRGNLNSNDEYINYLNNLIDKLNIKFEDINIIIKDEDF